MRYFKYVIDDVSYNLYKIDDNISNIFDNRYSEYYYYDKIDSRWIKHNLKYSIKQFLFDEDMGICIEILEAEISLIL